jgi:hypothetical protein
MGMKTSIDAHNVGPIHFKDCAIGFKKANNVKNMDIPPIIPQDGGQSHALPPGLPAIPPKITQARSQQTASASRPREIPRRINRKMNPADYVASAQYERLNAS